MENEFQVTPDALLILTTERMRRDRANLGNNWMVQLSLQHAGSEMTQHLTAICHLLYPEGNDHAGNAFIEGALIGQALFDTLGPILKTKMEHIMRQDIIQESAVLSGHAYREAPENEVLGSDNNIRGFAYFGLEDMKPYSAILYDTATVEMIGERYIEDAEYGLGLVMSAAAMALERSSI